MTRRTWANTLARATGGPQTRGTLAGDVIVPVVQAGITGVLAGLLAQALDWPGVVVGLGAALAAWIFRPGAVQLPVVEVGAPKAELAQTVRLNIVNLDGKQADYLQLGITPQQLAALASGLAGGATLSTRQWTGARGVFSQADFVRLRSELIRRNLAKWASDKDVRSGAQLTPQGRATMKALARPHPKPPNGLQSSQRGG